MNDPIDRHNRAFQPDEFGELRDIYVLDTDERDWQRVLDYLHGADLPLTFRVDGHTRPLPASIQEILMLRRHAAPQLGIDLDGVLLSCYFFTPSTIEFDLDPRDVLCPERADRVVGFMQDVADLLGKPVILTPENRPEEPLLRREPAARVVR
jgi:hypothetical protein